MKKHWRILTIFSSFMVGGAMTLTLALTIPNPYFVVEGIAVTETTGGDLVVPSHQADKTDALFLAEVEGQSHAGAEAPFPNWSVHQTKGTSLPDWLTIVRGEDGLTACLEWTNNAEGEFELYAVATIGNIRGISPHFTLEFTE